jgi:CubicO group peptidase (beta-lactamase class C family)
MSPGWTAEHSTGRWRKRGGPWRLFAVFLLAAVPAVAFEPLQRATPDFLGVDPGGIERFLDELDRVPGARSVVVVYRDRVIAEAYWTGTAATLHHVRSVTKSVTSTLVGIAIDRGFIEDEDQRMIDYLPSSLWPQNAAKDEIRIRHLLGHTSGLQWEENREFMTWAGSSNPVRFILNRPLVSEPGTDFNYSTPATHVLSAVLREATGVDVEVFADSYLFSPLGISSWRWEGDPLGYPFGGHGLQLRTEDMAKLGMLFLHRGRWGEQQVISSEWVGAATRAHYQGSADWGVAEGVSYGFLWWLASAGETGFFMALGWGGQFVICVPALDLVVAINARWQLDAQAADAQERAILEVVVEELLPLIPVRRHPPHRAGGRVRPSAGLSVPGPQF